MNWKVIFVGGIVYYAAQWVVGAVTGPLLHQGLLVEAYQAHAALWRPELNQVPPDMAALMPRWITTGLIASFLSAGVYDWIRPALGPGGWMNGVKFGVIALVFGTTFQLGYSGIFNLADSVWAWWWLESAFYFLIGGAALGWVAQKLAPAAK